MVSFQFSFGAQNTYDKLYSYPLLRTGVKLKQLFSGY